MARRSGFLHALAQAQREAERKRTAQLRNLAQLQTQAAKAAEKARKEYERAQLTDQKERARLYTESRIAQVNLQNEQLDQAIARLSNILRETLAVDSFIDLQTLKQAPEYPVFNPGQLGVAEPPPVLQMYLPPELTGIQKLLPGAKEKQAQEVARAYEVYRSHASAHAAREQARQQSLTQAGAMFDRQVAEEHQKIAAQHTEIDNFQRELLACSPSAVVNYFTLVLEASDYPDGFPQHAKIAFVPESKQLVIEYDLPSFDVIPEVGAYKYVKTKDEVTEAARPLTQRKVLYSSVVAQVTLRTLYELFKSDRMGHLDIVVFNGYVSSIDKGTGRPVRTCLITVRTTRDTFMQLDLSKVDPLACLSVLNASVSKSPTELAPVRPVLEFNMVDPRFIEEVDVLSGIDQRPNLMDLTPSEFESLRQGSNELDSVSCQAA
jgi:restriction system protein